MRIPFAKEGLPFVAIFMAVAGSLTVGFDTPWPGIVGWVLVVWCIAFFRDPERTTPEGEGLVIAPADGVVCHIEETTAPLSGEPARKFSIFMNVFNVHVNRMPVAGRIVDLAYRPGKFVNADLDKASIENERQEILVETANGTRIAFVQVAGLVARRIICKLDKNETRERGERFGLIRFGSRVDVYLPLSAEIGPGLGEKTRSGETVIARLEG